MNTPTLESVRATLLAAGLDVFRVQDQTVHLAERVRSHLMDAGVRVRCEDSVRVDVTVRAQSSDFPSESAAELLARVRSVVVELAAVRGFVESGAISRDIRDPMDASRLLDVWHELTFTKPDCPLDALIDDVRWAIRLPKCITR